MELTWVGVFGRHLPLMILRPLLEPKNRELSRPGVRILNTHETHEKLLMKKLGTVCMALACLAAGASAQPLDSIKSQEELNKAIASLDAALFDSYNRCDLPKFASFFVDDVEFYHDQGGVTLGKKDLTDSVRKNICGKVTRELVPGTLQVHAMKGYGALEMGVHRFHHPGHEDTEPVGEGRFIHLWRYKDGAWKIPRVVSYDHHLAAK
jgi:ketosteroid isomerase-like protein